jgi:hypothetical protein
MRARRDFRGCGRGRWVTAAPMPIKSALRADRSPYKSSPICIAFALLANGIFKPAMLRGLLGRGARR